VPAPGTNVDIDYFEPGGIYREVCLRAVPQIFIDDVFAKPLDVLSTSPRLEVECTIDAAVVPQGSGLLSVEVIDPESGARTGSAVVAAELDGAGRSWYASVSTGSPRSRCGTSSAPSSTTW